MTVRGPALAAVPSSRRIAGIDMARALAIIGMVAVHVSPSGTGSAFAYVLAVPRGRAAILFGLVAGIGVSLLASSRATSASRVRLTLLWRAAVLLPLGLALQSLDHDVYVILADYAVLFLLAMVVLRWPDRWLLALAGLSATLGGAGYLYGRLEAPAEFTREPAELGMPVLDGLQALVVSGPYPLITWAAPFCLGIWLGRRDLGARRVRRRLMIVGGGVAVVVPVVAFGLVLVGGAQGGWWQLLDDAPHSQTPLWLLSATGSALAVLGVSLWSAERAPRLVAPLAAAGRHAFTWYVVHLLVLHLDEGWVRTGTIPGTFAVVAAFVVLMAVASSVWSGTFSRGPLEYALRPPWRLSAPAARRAS